MMDIGYTSRSVCYRTLPTGRQLQRSSSQPESWRCQPASQVRPLDYQTGHQQQLYTRPPTATLLDPYRSPDMMEPCERSFPPAGHWTSKPLLTDCERNYTGPQTVNISEQKPAANANRFETCNFDMTSLSGVRSKDCWDRRTLGHSSRPLANDARYTVLDATGRKIVDPYRLPCSTGSRGVAERPSTVSLNGVERRTKDDVFCDGATVDEQGSVQRPQRSRPAANSVSPNGLHDYFTTSRLSRQSSETGSQANINRPCQNCPTGGVRQKELPAPRVHILPPANGIWSSSASDDQTRPPFVRLESSSDDSGFHERCSQPFGSSDMTEMAPNMFLNGSSRLEAHSLSLSYSPAVDGAGSSPKKLTSTPNIIRRHLKTIAEGLDGLTALRKSSPLRPKPLPARGRRVLERSSSEPEGLDRLGDLSDSSPTDDVEFGFEMSRSVQRGTSGRDSGMVSGVNSTSPTVSGQSDRLRYVGDDVTCPSVLDTSPKLPSAGPCSGVRTAVQCQQTGGGCYGNGRLSSRTNLLQLTDDERLTLRKIARDKLEAMDLGCSIIVPKSHCVSGRVRAMKKLMQLKRYVSSSTMTSTAGDLIARHLHSNDRSLNGGKGLMFGIPLEKCLSNELELSRQTTYEAQQSREDNLLEALSLSCAASRLGTTPSLRVPVIVQSCCRHLQTHGLQVPGIFRIAGSKSRVAMLRREFDSGHFVQLTSDHSIHDIASLLKEFLRDLPDPLLTRDLYPAFIAAAAIDDVSSRVLALRLLVALLPAANRDTLWTLLTFLSVIARHADNTSDINRQLVPGNKMDSSNLATVFGPNLLRRAKNSKYELDSAEEMLQNADVVAITKDLIDFHAAIFRVTKQLYGEVVAALADKNCVARDETDEFQMLNNIDQQINTVQVDITDGSDSSFRTTSSSCERNGQPASLDQSYTTTSPRLNNNVESFGSIHVRSSSATTESSPTASDDVLRRPLGDWQWQRWQHWQQLTQLQSKEMHEQQTLV